MQALSQLSYTPNRAKEYSYEAIECKETTRRLTLIKPKKVLIEGENHLDTRSVPRRFSSLYVPGGDCTTYVPFVIGVVSNDFKSFSAGGGVRDDPIAHFGGAIAGGFGTTIEKVHQRWHVARFEMFQALQIVFFIESAHVGFAYRMAQASSGQYGDSDVFRIAVDRPFNHFSPGIAASEAGHGRLYDIHDNGHYWRKLGQPHFPQRNHESVIQFQMMGK